MTRLSVNAVATLALLTLISAACSDTAATTIATTAGPPTTSVEQPGSTTTLGEGSTTTADSPATTTAPSGTATSTSSTTTTTTPSGLTAPRGSFRVRGVEADDVLNVRSGPGVNNAIVAVFPPNAIGIRTTGAADLAPNEREWWQVELFDRPETGWVNAQFLVRVDREPCSNDDGILAAPNVFVVDPRPGARVASGFSVLGCSRTFESTFEWRLLDRDGAVLSEGSAMGGGVDAPATFAFEVDYTGVSERQVGILEVYEPDISDGEGAPPVRNEIPVILTADGGPEPVNPPDPCSNADGGLDGVLGIFVTSPFSGQRVESGFELEGCSSTFEGTVPWRLLDRDGNELATGFVMGGGVEVAPFSGTVEFDSPGVEIGAIELFEDDVSEGEGFVPARAYLPIVFSN